MIVVFRSRLRPGADLEAYDARVEQIFELGQAMPGFRSIRDYVHEDGERLAVIEFEGEQELEAWRDHAEHLLAQQEGRDEWYASYHLQVARLVRESSFERDH